MRVATLQLNFVIGDIANNCQKIIKKIEELKSHADLLLFSELAVTGYPPMDLLENRKMIRENRKAAEQIAASCLGVAAVFGFINDEQGILYNSAAFAHDGKIRFIQNKGLLPTYDVFDEHRYFSASRNFTPYNYMGYTIGITICEDIWNSETATANAFTDSRNYDFDPVEELISKGADLLLNISASPFVSGKGQFRIDFISKLAANKKIPIVYCNQVGGNDSLIFDGTSFFVNTYGVVHNSSQRFCEDVNIADLGARITAEQSVVFEPLADLKSALILGVRDYVQKCGFKKTVLGLSGGIDSALTAAIAVEALGAENVHGITMPSKFSSSGSVDDSYALAKNLGITIDTIPIAEIFELYNKSLVPLFSEMEEGVTEENLQARIRGTLLMAYSNKFGAMLLTTGNKSELAMGYCTLYGDMSGGLAVISDLPKTIVFKLARFINKDQERIPWNTIEKPPSAELRENQKDEDSLPPYEVLDAILCDYIEYRKSREEIVAGGYDPDIVDFVLKMVDRNEYKRRQAAPGLKVTSKAFGSGRRIPMAQRFQP